MPTDLTNRRIKKGVAYKRDIARSFDKAALLYDDFALFQQHVLAKLITYSPDALFSNALDLGCGTGNAASFLESSASRVIALDLSPNMLKISAEKYRNASLVCADAENMPFSANKFDLVFSNLAIQWSQDLAQLSNEVNRVLSIDGYFLGTSLCKDSMTEIANCWNAVDGRSHTNHYLDYQETITNLVSSELSLVCSDAESVTMWFASPEEAVHSLKKIGASVLEETSGKLIVTPSLWKQFLAEYEKLRTDKGIPLTYQVVYFLLKK